MRKALAIATMALICAAVVPSIAQAEQLVNEMGTPLVKGTSVTLTSENFQWRSAWGDLRCESVEIRDHVVTNSPEISLSEEMTTFSGCNVPISGQVGPISAQGEEGEFGPWSWTFAEICDSSGNVPFIYEPNTKMIEIAGEFQLDGNCGTVTASGSFELNDPDGSVFIAAGPAEKLVGGGGIPLTKGTNVTLESNDLEMRTAIGTVTCEKVDIDAQLHGVYPEINLPATAMSMTGCNATMTDTSAGEIFLGGEEGGVEPVTMTIAGVCSYVGWLPLTYEQNSDTVTLAGEDQLGGVGHSKNSKNCGPMTLSGSFALTDAEGPVFIG